MSITIIAALAAAPATSMTMETYTNARFGYSICYPSGMIPQGEADNGDGQVFVGADGSQLRVFGGYNALGYSPEREVTWQARHLTGPKGQITYRAMRNGWAVASGNDGAGHVFYAKTTAQAGRFVQFQLTYPQTAAALYAPLVAKITRCFRPRITP